MNIDFNERIIQARSIGRYLERLPVGSSRGQLIGFHGYAENAEIQLRRQSEQLDTWHHISVEGLNKFYNRENTVVSHWMTSWMRTEQITINREYCDLVLSEVLATTTLPTVLIGFSQGAAQCYRMLAYSQFSYAAALIIGGELPPELAEQGMPQAETASTKPTIVVFRGKNDPHFSAAQADRDCQTLQRLGFSTEVRTYHGRHEWNAELNEQIRSVLQVIGNHVRTNNEAA